MMKNTGIHHVSVLVRSAEKAYDFYTNILGLKMFLKTVNQDDSTMYHLFFGDQEAREGTEFTVFEMSHFRDNQFGTNAIERVMFLVPSVESLYFWQERLEKMGVLHYGIETFRNQEILRFEDFDGMKLGLMVAKDASIAKGTPHPEIPDEHLIFGMGAVFLRVRYLEASLDMLTTRLGFTQEEPIDYFNHTLIPLHIHNLWQHEIYLIEDKDNKRERLGVGGMHHIAFGVDNEATLAAFAQYLDEENIHHSGIVNREFFQSLYYREPNSILYEIATPPIDRVPYLQTPQATFDEYELILPSFLEDQRATIERDLAQQER